MFSFFGMIGNYESRKVANNEINGAVIDTVAVTDSEQPYETGIKHPNFDNGNWIIVEMYEDEDSAKDGHIKWVDLFKKGIPKELSDVSTCELKKFFSVGDIKYNNDTLN